MAKLSMPDPKRVAPADVPAITLGSLRYEALHWGRERGLGQNGGLIDVVDVATGQSVGVITVYRIEYQAQLESDVQDVFFKQMQLQSDGTLLIENERGRTFKVDTQGRRSIPMP